MDTNCNRHLAWVDNFLSKKSVFAGTAVEQTPVHLDVPGQRVARPDDLSQYPQIEERAVLCIVVAVACCSRQQRTVRTPLSLF